MTPEEAAWVRENAWTGAMRKTHREMPGYFLSCACQYGITGSCRNGSHNLCPRATPLPRPVGYVCRRSGEAPAYFAEPYEHPHLTATGRHPTAAAMVWYADRLCRWACPCDCHTGRPPTTPAPLYARRPAAAGQGALFDLQGAIS